MRKRLHCQESAKYVPCEKVNLVMCPKWPPAGSLSNEASTERRPGSGDYSDKQTSAYPR